MMEFISIQQSLPELEYKEPELPEKRCGNCKSSYCYNPGASINSYSCKEIKKMLKDKKLDSYEDKKGNYVGYSAVIDIVYGICNKHKTK